MTPKLDWREVWRRGIAPQLTRLCLVALRDALASGDARLCRGVTVEPTPAPKNPNSPRDNRPVTHACVLALVVWQGQHLLTIEDVLAAFGKLCHECEIRCGWHIAAWEFTEWFDRTPPRDSYPQLLREVELSLSALPEEVSV